MGIKEVERAAMEAREANERLRQAVAEAIRDGVAAAKVARAADINWRTVRSWADAIEAESHQ